MVRQPLAELICCVKFIIAASAELAGTGGRDASDLPRLGPETRATTDAATRPAHRRKTEILFRQKH